MHKKYKFVFIHFVGRPVAAIDLAFSCYYYELLQFIICMTKKYGCLFSFFLYIVHKDQVLKSIFFYFNDLYHYDLKSRFLFLDIPCFR